MWWLAGQSPLVGGSRWLLEEGRAHTAGGSRSLLLPAMQTWPPGLELPVPVMGSECSKDVTKTSMLLG